MFTYTTLSLTMAGALVLFAVMSFFINSLQEAFGYRLAHAVVWVLVALHWVIGFTLVIGYNHISELSVLSDWFVLGIASGILLLFIAYVYLRDRLVREGETSSVRASRDTLEAR